MEAEEILGEPTTSIVVRWSPNLTQQALQNGWAHLHSGDKSDDGDQYPGAD